MTTFNDCVGLDPTKPQVTNTEDDMKLKFKKMKTKLINEEHRLVLMKKIRQSQTRPAAASQIANQQLANSNSINNVGSFSRTNSNPLSGGHMKKFRPNQLAGSLSLHKNNASSSSGAANLSTSIDGTLNNSASSTSSLNQTPAHAHQRPKINTLWNPPPQQSRHPTPVGIAPPHVGNLNRQPITTPPNVVQALMGGLTDPQSLLMNQINAVTNSRKSQQQQQLFSGNSKNNNPQLLLSKRNSSFKPSIQKQLEQTLMLQQSNLNSKHGQQSPLSFNNNNTNLNKRTLSNITSPLVGNTSRQPITTPPNVVQDMRSNLSGPQSLLINTTNLQSSHRRHQQTLQNSSTPTGSYNKSQAAQLLLQKRSAAKSAIQKTLEQSLMQLPQKHIQLGIDFVPNANNIEFVYYVGLEACVDYLTSTKNPLDTQPLEKPFECSTCGTDFTPSWSFRRTNAVCENCVGNHVKKSVKNSQTNRIKSVLAKAAKQEQEVEQKIMAEATNVVSSQTTPTTSTSQQHSLLQPSPHLPRATTNNSPLWPRNNSSPLTTASNSNRQSTNVQQSAPTLPNLVGSNPLAGLQPGALASLIQMNPQLSSLMGGATNTSTNNNTNQLAQVAALFMNQLTMNLWKR